MIDRRPARGLALLLTLTLALAPCAQAISVEEARQLLKDNYIDPIPDEILNLPTIQEITDALGDPYTYHMTVEEYESFENTMSDTNVTGIGAMVSLSADGLEISAVAPGSPAAKSGLKAGDLVIGVDGTTLEAAGSPEALSQLVRGEAGSQVTLTFIRDGETKTVTLTREDVVFPTVIGEVVDGHIGWLDVSSFGETTGQYFNDYILEEDEAADHWVVDLRGNPGGYATAVIQAMGYIVGNVPVSYLVNNKMEVGVWRPNPFPVEIPGLIEEPMIVIVDGASASASELFAAAIRDYDYGLIIGTRTFGKGIAQNVFPQEDGSVMKITTDRYYSPNWVTPDHTGVLPHLVVDPSLAPAVARLLSGKETTQDSAETLKLTLNGRTWYVHKGAATAKEGTAAFTALLQALAPDAPLSLNGKPLTAAEAAKAWGAEYTSPYFTDLGDTEHADKINTLAVLGVLNGDEDGSFHPAGQLTRAELCAMLTQAMGYWSWKSQGEAPFRDVSAEDWFANPVTIMYHLGLIQGNGEGQFDPDGLVDHQQFLTILARAGAQTSRLVGDALAAELSAENLNRPEFTAYADWSRQAVSVAEELGFLGSPLAELIPGEVTTREEAAVMLYNMMHYMGVIYPMAAESAEQAAA